MGWHFPHHVQMIGKVDTCIKVVADEDSYGSKPRMHDSGVGHEQSKSLEYVIQTFVENH